MSKYGRYIPGDRYVICADCGVAYRLNEMQEGVAGKQKGFSICPSCFDPTHPLDNVPKLRPAPPMEKRGIEGVEGTSDT